MTFTDARHSARMTRKEVADYLNISMRTISKYEATEKAPKAIIECLLMIGGTCPNFSRRNDFSGWTFGNGYIYSPAGDKFTSGDVMASIYDKQLIRSQRVELKALKKQLVKSVSSNIIPFPARRLKKDLLA